jgi:hypothetical protein
LRTRGVMLGVSNRAAALTARSLVEAGVDGR